MTQEQNTTQRRRISYRDHLIAYFATFPDDLNQIIERIGREKELKESLPKWQRIREEANSYRERNNIKTRSSKELNEILSLWRYNI